MEPSSSLSNKSGNTTTATRQDFDKKSLYPVNWISVINFLENQYTKTTIRQKQWFLQQKILQEQNLKLKDELTSVESLNFNLKSRIRLLQNALKMQKLMKNKNPQNKQQNLKGKQQNLKGKQQNSKDKQQIQKTRTIQAVEKYFQKNGWNLSQKPKSLEQNIHKRLLNKVLDEVGINFGKIQEKCRKMSLNSLDSEKLQRKDNTKTFKALINDIGKIKVSYKIKINAHLDSVRGIYVNQNKATSQHLLATVSQDCLIKTWKVDLKNKQTNQSIQPSTILRQHTGQLFALDGGQTNIVKNDLVLFTGGTQQYVKVIYCPSVDKPTDLKCIGSFVNDQKVQSSQEYENQIIWHLKYKENKLLTSASDGIVRLFKTQIHDSDKIITSSVTFLKRFAQKNYTQTVVQWVGEGGFLSACANNPRIHLWDIETARIIQKFTYQIDKPKQDKTSVKKQTQFNENFQVNSLKYSPNCKTLYTGCQDKSIRIFSYNENKIIKKLDLGINASVNCIDFYKNNLLAAGCQNGNLKVWDCRTYKLLFDQNSHKTKYDEGILSLKTTQQGIFTGGADGTVNFYGF